MTAHELLELGKRSKLGAVGDSGTGFGVKETLEVKVVLSEKLGVGLDGTRRIAELD
jgi:hypothetical protein